MNRFYANVPPPAHPSHHQPQFVSATPYSHAAPHAFAAPHNQSSLSFDDMIKERYSDSSRRILDAISCSGFQDPKSRQQCADFVRHIRIHRNLFMHTYLHLVSCCKNRNLQLLVENAKFWSGWDSVKQLTHHSLIKDNLLSFWAGYKCHQHKPLHLVISDDESDLLCHLLCCGKKRELYELSNKPANGDFKESEQIIELLWQFIVKGKESNVTRRLRAMIYRMARKSAYLPHALQIAHPSISHRRDLAGGAHGMVTKATMNGRSVAIKKILCGNRATQRKCFEMFAGEAILWKTLQHKNIVPFLGVVAEGTFDMGLVSPFFQHGNVKNYLEKFKPEDRPALTKRFARDLAEGLEYIHCHEPPIIHGDLKGDNVLVDDSDHARLGDFGQSHASDSGKYLDSTRVGLATNNPVHWMAPELMVGGELAKFSDKTDIYSFGCVLYEMVSGKIPFENLQFTSVVERVRNGERPSRPGAISRHDLLWKITESCWRDRPENRPSATDLISKLRSV